MDQASLTQSVGLFVFELGAIVIAAKLGAELAERLGQPPVLGEILAGVVIGPHALGGLALRAADGSSPTGESAAISPELSSMAQLAAVVLLFSIGLNTNLLQFVRYSHASVIVAVAGNLLSFLLGAGAAVALGIASDWTHPRALLVGALVATTSVGVSARILSDLGRLDTPEGATIVGGAVVDDILGIVELGLAASIAAAPAVTLADLALGGMRAVGAIVALTGLAVVVVRQFPRIPVRFRTEGAAAALALGSALISAYLMERAGLALILGAYAIGLALSQSAVGRRVERALLGFRQVLVPVFFVVMGAMVDIPDLMPALGPGLVLCVVAVLGKAIGCGLPALALRFGRVGALRIAVGMLPRGEVALIVASIGLTTGVLGADVFGVAILVVIVTTLLCSVLFGATFRSGAAIGAPAVGEGATRVLRLSIPMSELFLQALEETLVEGGLTEVARYRDLEETEIAEFRGPEEDQYLSIALLPADEDTRVMQIELGAGDWPALATAAIDRAVRRVAFEVLEPLLGDGDEARTHARRYLVALLEADRELGV